MDEEYIPKWTILYILQLAISSISCLLAAWVLKRSISISTSCICLATFAFFVCKGLYSLFRTIFYLLVLDAYLTPQAQSWTVTDERHDIAGLSLIGHQRDQEGVSQLLPTYIAVVILVGDALNLESTLWMFISITELLRLASKSVDRGIDLEKKMCKYYSIAIRLGVVCYTVIYIVFQSTSAIVQYRTHAIVMITAIVESSIILLSMYAVAYLRHRGRSLELVHGRFIRAPLYARLRRIVYV